MHNPSFDIATYFNSMLGFKSSTRHTHCTTQCLPENFAPLVVENIKKGAYTHVLTGHSAFGKNIMPRVAAMLDSQQISDVTGIESEDSM